MAAELDRRFPDLGKLSVAILEHLTSPVIGEEAKQVLKEPFEEKQRIEELAEALSRAEQSFIKAHPDDEVAQSLLQLPLSSLPSVKEAVLEFYYHPTSTNFREVLASRLSENLPKRIELETLNVCVDDYMLRVRYELATTSLSDLRAKLDSLAVLDIRENLQEVVEVLVSISSVLDERLPLCDTDEVQQTYTSVVRLRTSILQDDETAIAHSTVLKQIDDLFPGEQLQMTHYEILLQALGRLADTEFRALIYSLLTPEEQVALEAPVWTVNRADFLGYMQRIDRLNAVENYLKVHYSQRFDL